MRLNLKNARREKAMSQQQMADKLFMSLRQYQRVESGEANGTFETWDALEDYLKVHQRTLREISNNHPSQVKNQ